MAEEYFNDIKALVASFLTSKLKESPNGVSLEEFVKRFPTDADEPEDWFRRAGKKQPLEALQLVGDPVIVTQNNGRVYISLNQRSELVDRHMADLVSNQKSSAKRRRGPAPARPHYLRARDSFDMNRRYSNSSSNDRHMRARLNYGDHPSRNDNYNNRSRPSPVTPPYYSNNSTHFSWGNDSGRSAPGDPRSRASASNMMPPPMRPSIPNSSGPSPARQSVALPTAQFSRPESSRSSHQNSTASVQKSHTREPDDPTLDSKKSAVRKRLLVLLTQKYRDVKLLYLNQLFEMEYKERIDPVALGHKTLTTLLQDPYFNEYIKITQVGPLLSVSARNMTDGKENIATNNGNLMSGLIDSSQNTNDKNSEALADRSNHPTSLREKFRAIRPFNLETMLQSLEPLRDVKEIPLGNNEVVDCIKYRTMRIIFKSQNPKLTLRLDDWEMKYQQEWNCKSKIQIRDFGHRTLLEFFKYLATQLPIKIRLNNNDEWIAVGDYEKLSSWLKKKMDEGAYRAITAIDAKYEQVAFPNEKYNYSELKDLPNQDYYPVIVMSVKMPFKFWVQIRTQKRVEDHLSIESSLVCYEDYKRKGFFSVPDQFVKPGFPCVAYDVMQQRWCRAIVLKVNDMKDDNTDCITAFLVDYAITKSFSRSQLLCILKSHLKRPVGLLYAQLYNVPEESTTARRILQEYTSPPVTLACKIIESLGVVKGDNNPSLPRCCYSVTLIDTRQGKDCNIADDINSYKLSPIE